MTTEQAFALKVSAGLVAGGWFIIWQASQQPTDWRRWFDVYLGTILGAILGARVFFVLLHLESFLQNLASIPRLWYAELTWQGAVVGGLLAMVGMCRWQKVSFPAFADGTALALPVVVMAIFVASRSAGLIVGEPVADLESVPTWQAGFLPDVNRDVVPRYELQMLGMALGGVLLLIALGMQWTDTLVGRRLWINLALLGGIIVLLDHLSAEQSAQIAGISIHLLSVVGLWVGCFAAVVAKVSANRMQTTMPHPQQDRL